MQSSLTYQLTYRHDGEIGEYMKHYIITYTGGLISPAQAIVKAPNKTMARRIFKGEHIPSIKILSIVDKKEEV